MNEGAVNQLNRLLRPTDPQPYTIVAGAENSPVVVICEHAGRAIPSALGDLGLSPAELDLHIAYDIGAERVSREMAAVLNAPLVLQPYSRLVIDCNRPVDSPESILETSHGVPIAGNRQLSPMQRQQRIDEIFTPYHDAVSAHLDETPRKAVFAVHSFTRILNGAVRPWDVGFLYRKDEATSSALATAMGDMALQLPGIDELNIGMNAPYNVEDRTDWFVPHHGEGRGIAHSLIEIRNDRIVSEDACIAWGRALAGAVTRFLGEAVS
ncbi:MAG: N-formylglutamate amidohydrolase [Alphaproteobacteria bacterium]|nr:N-formylglutamate amidohydrolase [Alphaproteobacteria bacterium]